MTRPGRARGFEEPLQVALVNNMPDAAVEATEAQFSRLLRRAAPGAALHLRRYGLASATRSETARRQMARSHEDVAALYARGADLLIVTGTEPRAERLESEPFFDDMARLVDWARGNTLGAVWSCLAAHVAVLAMDGLQRRRAAEKFSGIYRCEIIGDWAFEGAGATILAPHSRYNGLAREELESRGYHVASFSREVGVDCFWRREPSLFLFAQGHPEYDADTLAREFRRDALRFAGGRGARFPPPPANYFSQATCGALAELALRAADLGPRGFAPRLDRILAQERPKAGWGGDAGLLYRNWLNTATAAKKRDLRSA